VALVGYAVTRSRAIAHHLRLPPGVPLRITGVPARALFETWRWTGAPRIDRWTGPVDVVHGTNFVVPPTRAAALVTVHDVAFLRRPDLVTAASRRYAGLLRAAIRRGATVHVFSDTVGADVVELLRCPAHRVVRIHPGIAPTGAGDPTTGHRLAGAERYVLALGTVEPRKNYPRLVAAFDRVAADDPELRLVVAGSDGWGRADLDDAVRAARHGTRVVRLGYVSDTQRGDLLAGAAMLAYPSLDEGFGHPPLEAMRAGIPVMAGRAGSLPEVLGEAAAFADPTSVGDLASVMADVLGDAALRARLVAAGTRQAARYTWARCSEALVDCYRALRDTPAHSR
jgi:glycosyltransferase involved in cell wall biosynthesis